MSLMWMVHQILKNWNYDSGDGTSETFLDGVITNFNTILIDLKMLLLKTEYSLLQLEKNHLKIEIIPQQG